MLRSRRVIGISPWALRPCVPWMQCGLGDDARNGAAALNVFQERWIPLEQAYFDAMKPQTRCSFLIEADQLSDEAPL